MPYKFILRGIIVLFLMIYPVLVYFGLSHFDERWIALGLFFVVILRSCFVSKIMIYRTWGIIAVGAIVMMLVTIFRDPIYLRLYPVLMTTVMFCVFFSSLYFPPTIIEFFARFSYKNSEIPSYVVEYARNVTKIWCLFFIFNGMISIYTVFVPLYVWTIYNGFISYLFMGALFIFEYAYRHLIVKKRYIQKEKTQ